MLVSFHANLHSNDISRDATVCTYTLFLPNVKHIRNSSVVSTLAFGHGGHGSIPGTEDFFGERWVFFFNDGKVIDTPPLWHVFNTDLSITLPSLKKYYKKLSHKKPCISGIELGPLGPKASVLTTKLFRMCITLGRKSEHVQTAASRDVIVMQVRGERDEHDVTMYTKRAMRHVLGLTRYFVE